MEANAQPTGMEALKQHVIANKIDVALWCTRGLTLFFSFFYLIPIFWSPYHTYYKALAAYAATSALRLHQRQPMFRLNMQFFASIMMEDSCHYLIYSMIFFYVAPFTLVLVPIFCFSLIHFASYSIRLLDVRFVRKNDVVIHGLKDEVGDSNIATVEKILEDISGGSKVLGPNSLWMARLLISLVEFNARSILNLIAFTEIMLMPFCIILVFTGRASFLTPFMYHRFLLMRYKSQRNPSTRNMFTELQYSATYLANHQMTPAFVRNIILAGINFVRWMEPTIVAQPAQ